MPEVGIYNWGGRANAKPKTCTLGGIQINGIELAWGGGLRVVENHGGLNAQCHVKNKKKLSWQKKV